LDYCNKCKKELERCICINNTDNFGNDKLFDELEKTIIGMKQKTQNSNTDLLNENQKETPVPVLDLTSLEASSNEVLLTTTDVLHNRIILEYLEPIYAENFLQRAEDFSKVFKNLTDEITVRAKDLGANAVISIKLESFSTDSSCGFVMYGTAVRMN